MTIDARLPRLQLRVEVCENWLLIVMPISVNVNNYFVRVRPLIFWSGLWAWPPWVICAPTLNHKLKTFCTFRGFLKLWMEELRTGQRKGHFHGPLRHRNSPTGEPFQDGRPIDRITWDPITPWWFPALSCLRFSPTEMSMLTISQFLFTT